MKNKTINTMETTIFTTGWNKRDNIFLKDNMDKYKTDLYNI